MYPYVVEIRPILPPPAASDGAKPTFVDGKLGEPIFIPEGQNRDLPEGTTGVAVMGIYPGRPVPTRAAGFTAARDALADAARLARAVDEEAAYERDMAAQADLAERYGQLDAEEEAAFHPRIPKPRHDPLDTDVPYPDTR